MDLKKKLDFYFNGICKEYTKSFILYFNAYT